MSVTASHIKTRKAPLGDRLKNTFFPGSGSKTRSDVRREYHREESFSDSLPWVEFLTESNHILFEDGMTRMAVYELDPIPTEGRSQDNLIDQVDSIMQIISDSFPEEDVDPWTLQIYANSEADIFHHYDRITEYVDERAKGTKYTERFLKDYKEHLTDVSHPDGFFYDEEVSDSVWRGQSFKIRLCVYRRYWNSKPVENPEFELEQVCAKLRTNLDSLNVKCKPVDGESFYYWMLAWLNPKPEICDGDPVKLKQIAPYPSDDEVPVGRDFADMVLLTPPKVDQKKRIWELDGLPHTVVEVLSLRAIPKKGHLSGEMNRSGKQFSIADKLPPGSVIAMTTTIEPQDTIANYVSMIREKAVGSGGASLIAKQEAELVIERMSTGDKLYSAEIAIYLRGNTYRELRGHVNTARSLLSGSGVSTIDPWQDAISTSNFKRNLPGVYIPEVDKNSAKRSRFMFVADQAAMAPMYGRSRGTNNPGLLFFNRSAEPLCFDPLNPDDRQKNAHMLVIGPTGAGKSATLNWIAKSMMAIHRPRIFIIEAGNSFGLLGDFFERNDVSVNAIRLNMGSSVAIPPFAETIKLVSKVDEEKLTDFADDHESLNDDLADWDSEDVTRDFIGESEIIARLMITGGEAKEEVNMSRSKRMVIRKAILLAANNVINGKSKNDIVLTEDVADAITELASTDEYSESKKELNEMADAMRMFTDGLNGHLFNRKGELWPEADVTIVDLAEAATDGKEDTLAVAYVSLIQHINQLVERDQNDSRPTIVLTDEGHIITTNPLLSSYVVKITKMWRKLGCWFWIATQNLEDFPDSARRMLNMMEYWIALKMPKDEIEQTSRFKHLTPEQETMMSQCMKSPGKYVEGVVLGDKLTTLIRVVPPSIALALAGTEKHEKAEREELMKEHGLKDHTEACEYVAEKIRERRRSSISTR